MNTRGIILKISIILPLVCAFFINSAVLSAQTQESSANQDTDRKAIKRIRFLQSIRDEIRTTQKDFQEVTRTVTDVNGRLAEVSQKVMTLKDQLANLVSQIEQTESMIFNVTVQIGSLENELVILFEEMAVKNAALENQKKMLLEYLEVIYGQESGLTDTTGGNDELSIAKLLLSDQSVGEQLQQLKYFSILEDTGHMIFDTLESLMDELKVDEALMKEKKGKLSLLYLQLSDEKKNLEVQRVAKAHLLEETEGEEDIFRRLLEESVKQQAQVQDDLDTLNGNLRFIREKIAELGDDFDPEDYYGLLSPQTTLVYDYINETRTTADPVFHWPLSPARGITAYYHDPSYKATFGFVHNAIDVRAAQDSLVRAPADGMVYKLKDNNYGYSYLILAHQGGFLTVYGHLSGFKVEEGDKVYTGQVIGYSGGTPGTKGAGYVTTGAHLHFEMMKGGKYVDPLDYLPLTYVPMDNLPEKYQARATGNKPKISRTALPPDADAPEGELTQVIERNAIVEGLTKKALQDQSTAD